MAKHNQKFFRALLDIGKELASITESDPLLDRILEISREVFHLDNAIIRLLSRDGTELDTVASFGYSHAAADRPIPLEEGIMGKAARDRRPILLNNLNQNDDYIPGIEAARSELAIPLIARDRVIGVFNVESCRANAFDTNDCDALSILAGQAAIAIDNAHLYQNLCQVSREKQNLGYLNEKILSNIGLGLYTVDQTLNVTSWNNSMAKMSGIHPSAALGKPLLEMFPTLEKEGVAERLRRVLKTGQAENLRLLHRGQAGQKRLQKRKLCPLKEDGSTTGVIVVVEDITEFEQLLAQTMQSEKLAEVGRMSAGIAHEINNPLTVIGFANQILIDNYQNTSEQSELLQRIDGEVERLKGLTSELLNYSSGDQEEYSAPTDLNETLREVCQLLQYEIKKSHMTVNLHLAELPTLNIDKNKFKQIFINIVLNAIQAMKKDGLIRIETEVSPDRSTRITFCDTGPGIAESLKEQIFEPFFTSREDGGGTGLGLYLCRKIVKSYHGTIVVKNHPEEGCCFVVTLPPSLICQRQN